MERYVSRVLNFGEGKANNIRRLLNSVAMHSHVEFFIIEAVLEHPEKTLSEIAHYVYPRTGEFSVTWNEIVVVWKGLFKFFCFGINFSQLPDLKWWRHKK